MTRKQATILIIEIIITGLFLWAVIYFTKSFKKEKDEDEVIYSGTTTIGSTTIQNNNEEKINL